VARWVNTLGKSTLAVAICDRCRFKRARADLVSDPNSPGLLVCRDCRDQFDPWRLPARGPERIVVDGVRTDGSVAVTADAPPARLYLDGSTIRLPTGAELVPRGFSWGRFGTVRPQDAADNLRQGANMVRIPLRWWGFYNEAGVDGRDDSQPNLLAPRNLAILDAMIQWAVDAGLWIDLFLDSDCGQNGNQNSDDAAFCDPFGRYPNGRNFWSDLSQRALFINLWRFIADRYKNTPLIGWLELLPEPNPTNFTDADILNFYLEVRAAIREIDLRTPVMIGGQSYNATKAQNMVVPGATDIIYAGNNFMFLNNSQAVNESNWSNKLAALSALKAAGYPVFVDQVGVVSSGDPDLSYERYMLAAMTAAGIGYARWEYRDNTQTDQYGLLYQDRYGNEVQKTARLNLISSYFKQP
jgi:hypothetical protein